MASRWTSAAQGAATGASLGTAVAPGLGTAVGGGVGAVAGLIGGGPSEAQLLEEKRMAELMRRQELGTLGLTEQEMQVALGQAQGAISQQQQAQRAQQAGLMASQDLGAGAVFRAQQEEASLKRKEMEAARQKVVERDIDEKRAQEAELMTLAGLAEKRAEGEREAMIGALGSLATTTAVAGQQVWQRNQAKELLAKQTEDRAAEALANFDKAVAGQDDAAVDAAFAAIGGNYKQDMAMLQNAQAIQNPDGLYPDWNRHSDGTPVSIRANSIVKRIRDRQAAEEADMLRRLMGVL